MSDDDGKTNLTPLSLSPSGPSGTRAWTVSVDESGARSEAAEDSAPPATAHTDEDSGQPDSPAQPDLAPTPSAEPVESTQSDLIDLADQTDVAEQNVEPPASDWVNTNEVFAADADQSAAPADGSDNVIAGAWDNDNFGSAAPIETATTLAAPENAALAEPTETPEPFATLEEFEAPEHAASISVESPGAAEMQTTQELREAVLKSLSANDASNGESLAVFDRLSQNFTTIMSSAREDAAVFGVKIMAFAQANASSNFELARAYSQARSLPEVLNVQAEYLKRQLDILNSHTKEMQGLAAELAAKSAAQLQGRRDI